MRRSLPTLLAFVVALIAPIASIVLPVPVLAVAPYTLVTSASYDVQADDRAIAVTVDVTFTNLTPNPPGEFSVFNEVPIAVHDAATSVGARDSGGKLDVAVKARNGADGKPVNVATVKVRAPLRLNKAAKFTLSYTLPDGKDASIRVRPSVVIFPVWSFGTSSQVRVQLPAAYEVRADGDPLTAARSGDITTLSSGKIADPRHWLALITADRETAMVTASQTLPLDGGTVDLNVRSWADDEAWGQRMLKLLTKALPRLQARIGLPYAGVGPLVVTEALPSDASAIDNAGAGQQELQIGFDQPPFTVLHQAAHIWLGPDLVADRWIREGLASHYAQLVARDLKLDAPYDPAKQAAAQKDHAFPLAEWTVDGTPDRSAYGYPASWSLVDGLQAKVGEKALATVLQRVMTGVDAYDPAGPKVDAATTEHPVSPLGSRSFLDQLEAVTNQDLAADFGTTVFGEQSAPLITQRSTARDAYTKLLAAAGDWAAPQPVRAAMSEWRFDDATAQMAEARTWLGDRDELLAAIEKAGLSSPDRLRDQYQTGGGDADSRVELEAEGAVVHDYQAVLDRTTGSRSFVERLGLLAGTDPDALLASAHGLFADGDLRGAADATSQAKLRLAGAQTSGLLRLASVAVIILVALAMVIYLLRRRRTLRRHDA